MENNQAQDATKFAEDLSIIASLGSADMPEIKELQEFVKTNIKPVAKEKPDGKPDDISGDTDDTTSTTDDTTSTDTDELDSSGLGDFFNGDQKSKYKFESNEDFLKALEKQFGAKDPKGLAKFMSSVNNWRKESQSVKEIQEKFEGLTNFLQSVPAPLAAGLQAYAKGEYQPELLARLAHEPDFTKPIERQNPTDVIKYFYPEFSNDDLSEYDAKTDTFENEKVQGAYNFVKTKLYGQEQKRLELQRAAIEEDAKKLRERTITSADSSVEFLKKSFPTINEKVPAKVDAILKSGDDSKILSLFKNSKGEYTKEAALRLAMAIDGYSQISTLKSLIEEQNKSLTTAVKDKKTPPAERGASPAENATQEEIVKRIEGMFGGRKSVY